MALKRRRTRWFVFGLLLTVILVVGSVAVGLAITPAPGDIVLVLEDDAHEWQYDDITQPISITRGCNITPESLDGPIMLVSGAAYTKTGQFISDEAIGANHEFRGFGVNTEFIPGRTSRGHIDSIDEDTTDALTLLLGPAAAGQMINSVDLDLDSRSVARVRIDFLDGGAVAFTEFYDLPDDAAEVNDVPPGGSLRLNVPQEPGNVGSLFDGMRISMESSKISLMGGGLWEDPSAHRTIFHLVESTPEISIDSTTNGSDSESILVGEPITWTNLVTNIGPVALHDVEVVDSEIGTIPCLVSDLAPGASTTCSADGEALAGPYSNEATATGLSPGSIEATATDTSGYNGLLGCGDSDSNGGPGLEDDPLGGYFNGPTKGEAECGAAVSLTTTNTGEEQTVNVAPPSGSEWDGVTGLVTIEWDIEEPSNDGITRTMQQLVDGDPLSEIVVPWCEDVVGISLASGSDWMYELDPDTTYPTATGAGDTCLVRQSTETVESGGDVYAQTTEVFYIWDDPKFTRR